MEDKLRNCIHSFQDELLSKAIALEVSKAAFIDEIAQRVQGLGMEARAEEKPVIKLVSIDVPRVDIHRILKDEDAAGTISEFVKMCIQCQNDDVSSEIDRYDDKSFVRNTHVTMLFWRESTQEEMKEKFSALLGANVEILATALLWDNSVAALQVNIAETTVDGRKVPASKNEFVHLTVWVSEHAKAFMSNRLPQRVKLGEAQRLELEVPVRLNGLISFWDSENNVIPILEP